jgi:hypothetical protein
MLGGHLTKFIFSDAKSDAGRNRVIQTAWAKGAAVANSDGQLTIVCEDGARADLLVALREAAAIADESEAPADPTGEVPVQ